MCRLLSVKSENEFDIAYHLEKFAKISKNSKEYQGHGWGCAYLLDGKWEIYKSIKPVWEDDISKFPKTNLLLVHARSAFQNKDITVENNMPFNDGKYIFIFNGELRSVRIKEEGRIGAEKIFNFIKRFDKGDMRDALNKAVKALDKRTKYLRAANIIIAENKRIYWASRFNEDPDYFTLRYYNGRHAQIICSEAYEGETGWVELNEGSNGEL